LDKIYTRVEDSLGIGRFQQMKKAIFHITLMYYDSIST